MKRNLNKLSAFLEMNEEDISFTFLLLIFLALHKWLAGQLGATTSDSMWVALWKSANNMHSKQKKRAKSSIPYKRKQQIHPSPTISSHIYVKFTLMVIHIMTGGHHLISVPNNLPRMEITYGRAGHITSCCHFNIDGISKATSVAFCNHSPH